MIDTSLITKLRAQTGAGIMDVKSALEEAGGDPAKAQEILRKKGILKAAKKGNREMRQGLIDAYVHNGRIGVLVEVGCETDFVARNQDFKQFVHEIAMHIAASDPQYVKPEDVPPDVLEKEREIYRAEAQGKPAEMVEKIVEGKLQKYYADNCLLRQVFFKDDTQTVEEVVKAAIAKIGENIEIRKFCRFSIGA